jgi:hypothetical protein
MKEQIEKAFTFHPATPEKGELYTEIRGLFKELALQLDELAPDCREKAVAMTNLETANFWINAAIARNW